MYHINVHKIGIFLMRAYAEEDEKTETFQSFNLLMRPMWLMNIVDFFVIKKKKRKTIDFKLELKFGLTLFM